MPLVVCGLGISAASEELPVGNEESLERPEGGNSFKLGPER